MRRHLYLRIYVGFLFVAVLCAGVAAIAMRISNDMEPNAYKSAFAEVLAEALPKQAGPALDHKLRSLGDRLALDIAMTDARGEVISSTSAGLSQLVRDAPNADSWHERRVYAMRLALPDGRSVAAVARDEHHKHGVRFFAVVAAILAAAALGCFPIARRITRRLERLQRSVERFGEGDLQARVAVHGRDEVAQLALSFNRALSRIEQLVTAQRRVLSSASHELRSPMTRLRLAIELLSEGQPLDPEARTKLLRECTQDIEELDALVEDVLLSARLDGHASVRPLVRVDLTAVLHAEAARVGARVEGPSLHVVGDERLLTRLFRNLLENAARYGAGTPIEVSAQREQARVVVRVCDGGPGVAIDDRERIFEPFYRPAGHREGTDGGVGLGLSLVRQIATHLRGSVRYRDREGGGSCFEVSLVADVTAS